MVMVSERFERPSLWCPAFGRWLRRRYAIGMEEVSRGCATAGVIMTVNNVSTAHDCDHDCTHNGDGREGGLESQSGWAVDLAWREGSRPEAVARDRRGSPAHL